MAAFARLVVARVGKALGMECGPETQGSPPRQRPDVSGTVSVASCTASVPLADGGRRTYQWCQANVFATALSDVEAGSCRRKAAGSKA